jgi:acetyl esterase/lipase
MKYIFLLLLMATVSVAYAQPTVIQLYEGKAPGSESWDWQEKGNDIVYNVTQPTLTYFPADPATANGTAVIIAPGGAFHLLAFHKEGTDVAKWLNAKGVSAFVLKYRLVRCLTDNPDNELRPLMANRKELDAINAPVIKMAMADGLNAVAYVRSHAAEYKINPNRIGFMGFSAGGTVAMSVIYNAEDSNRPNFIAPIYAYTASAIGSSLPKQTTPAFIVAATDDQLGLASHSVDIYSKWINTKQPAELHLYEKGGHGFGMRKNHIPTDTWIERFGDWLDQRGWLKR